jgi:predicted ATPase
MIKIMPFLTRIRIEEDDLKPEFPYNLPVFKGGLELTLTSNVTFFVGENGSGKSTIIESIADKCGFNLSGGNQDHNYEYTKTESSMSDVMRLSWFPVRISEGFFMRAESFYNFASYVDELAEVKTFNMDYYGGKSLHQQSHGESFLALFSNRFKKGIYILDEPEAALSPSRQLTFMSIIHALEKSGKAQFLIATHSPMLLCYPGATILSLSENGIEEVSYQDTEHFQLTKQFLNNPDAYLKHLLEE